MLIVAKSFVMQAGWERDMDWRVHMNPLRIGFLKLAKVTIWASKRRATGTLVVGSHRTWPGLRSEGWSDRLSVGGLAGLLPGCKSVGWPCLGESASLAPIRRADGTPRQGTTGTHWGTSGERCGCGVGAHLRKAVSKLPRLTSTLSPLAAIFTGKASMLMPLTVTMLEEGEMRSLSPTLRTPACA